MKGLHIDIFKRKGRSSDGIGNFSSQTDLVTLVGFFDHEPKHSHIVREDSELAVFETDNETPPVAIITRMVFGEPYLTAYPVNEDGTIDRNRMFGGTFVYSSDSRFPSPYPVPLHDRKEK
jgi:hypothetical protein